MQPPSSQAIKSHAGKARSYKPQKRALNETMLPMKKIEKSLTISHSQHRTLPIPTSIKVKEWGHEKKRTSTPEARKKNRKKNKIKQIIK